ncbi:MAG TPA: hypothetical protein VFV51_12900 [Vicinamibacterales bacterium]|nr:hypothetical protein [Vicinamibacterales bacterium]
MKGTIAATAVAVTMVATFVVAATTQKSPDTFKATATVKGGNASASAAMVLSIDRYATEAERAALLKAVQSGGGAAQAALKARENIGYIQLGERRTPIKYAWRTPMGSGELLTVATAEPILFLGGGLPKADAKSGFDVAVAILDVKNGQPGTGELAPAAQVAMDENGALRIKDYSSLVIWLNGLVRGQ